MSSWIDTNAARTGIKSVCCQCTRMICFPEEAEVRAIDATVEKMDIPSMGFTYSETKETGRMPYNPVDMLKL